MEKQVRRFSSVSVICVCCGTLPWLLNVTLFPGPFFFPVYIVAFAYSSVVAASCMAVSSSRCFRGHYSDASLAFLGLILPLITIMELVLCHSKERR